MSEIDFIFDRLEAASDARILGFKDSTVSARELVDKVRDSARWLRDNGVKGGDAVVLKGDFSIESVALLLALIDISSISIPLTPSTLRAIGDQLDEVQPDFVIDSTGQVAQIEKLQSGEVNRHYKTLRERKSPGLVLFTSGSTGRPKAVVHDYALLLNKFRTSRPSLITLNFLLFDHWGGLNTLLHSLSNCAMLVLPSSRAPDQICALIAQHKVELLPATPSFLNLMLLGRAHQRHDLSSLRVISYGAEPMPESTLATLRREMPNVELRQTYGMIELGVLRAKSKDDSSLWVKLGGEGYDLRVADGILQVKADSAMLGYINGEAPFTEDGYFITGDAVEQSGDYLKILGRMSDLINVGGQKAYPAEIETVLLEIEGVRDAAVFGEKNRLLGNIVCATILTEDGQDLDDLKRRIKSVCGARLQPYMVPSRITFQQDSLQNHRLKRQR